MSRCNRDARDEAKESWLSGRKHLTANEAIGNDSGVRISHSPQMKGEAIFDILTHRNKTTGGELTCFTSSGNPTKERSSSEPSSAEMRRDDTGQTWLDMYSQYPFIESKKVGD